MGRSAVHDPRPTPSGKAKAKATARLFFAAWPAPETQRALGRLAVALKRDCGGRAIASGNIHLTLAFLGSVDRSRLPRIGEIAATVSAPRFELDVAGVEYWRDNRIVWAGMERCPDALRALAAGLERALSPEGFRFERRPYVPHITLLRDARRAPPVTAIAPIHLPVYRFALVESLRAAAGPVYEVLRDWPLGTQMSA